MSELPHPHDQIVSRFKFTGEDSLFPSIFDGDMDGVGGVGIKLSRRDFFTVAGGAAGSVLLAACGVSPTPTPTEIPSPSQSPTAAPKVETPTPKPATATARPTDIPPTNAPESTKQVEAAPANGLNHADALKVAADRVAQASEERGKVVTLEDLLKEQEAKVGKTKVEISRGVGDWYAMHMIINNPLVVGSYEAKVAAGTATFVVVGYPDSYGKVQVVPVLFGVSDGKNGMLVPSLAGDTPELYAAAKNVPQFGEKEVFKKWFDGVISTGGIKNIGIVITRPARFGSYFNNYNYNLTRKALIMTFIPEDFYAVRLTVDKKNWETVDPALPNLIAFLKLVQEQAQSGKSKDIGLVPTGMSVR